MSICLVLVRRLAFSHRFLLCFVTVNVLSEGDQQKEDNPDYRPRVRCERQRSCVREHAVRDYGTRGK